MEPVGRIAFEYPVYGMDVLDDDSIVIAGGGGRMKSGIPNACEILSFDPQTHSLRRCKSATLDDAPVALAVNGNLLITVVGTGCKNFLRKSPTSLTPVSTFHYDLQVSSTQEQAAVAVAPNGSRLAVASDDGDLTVLRLPHYELVHSKKLHTQGIIDLSISTDGALIATAARDRAAYICRTDSVDVVQKIGSAMPDALHTHIRAIRFAPGEPALIFTVESNPRKGGWIAAWRSPDDNGGGWSPIACAKASKDAVTAFAISPSADFAAVSSAEGHVSLFRWNGASFSRLWSTEPGMFAFQQRNPPHVLPVTAIRFSRSSDYLFTASADYTVAMWPTSRAGNWRGKFRVLFWVVSLLMLLVAVLLADDEFLHPALRGPRSRVQPHLEPFLSNVREGVSPILARGKESMGPFFRDLNAIAKPKINYIRDRAESTRTSLERRYSTWKPIITNYGTEMLHQAKGRMRSSTKGRTPVSETQDTSAPEDNLTDGDDVEAGASASGEQGSGHEQSSETVDGIEDQSKGSGGSGRDPAMEEDGGGHDGEREASDEKEL